MKNLTLLFSFLFLTFTASSQNCNDLIVSEIVFGKVSGKATQYNHSIEVYNPTGAPIDLANYQIELVPETGQSTVINLWRVSFPLKMFL